MAHVFKLCSSVSIKQEVFHYFMVFLEAMATKTCACERRSIDDLDLSPLKEILPNNYAYRICQFETDSHGGFFAIIRLTSTTKEEAQCWKMAFQQLSNVTLRITRTYVYGNFRRAFREDLHCQHAKAYGKAKEGPKLSSKYTGCRAKMEIIVKTIPQRIQRATDCHLPSFPTVVKIWHTHNHPIHCADALRFRDVSNEVKEKFLELFKNGHSPASALESHKYDLQADDDCDYVRISADRAKVPDIGWCYRLYYSQANEQYGDDKGMIENLQSMIDKLNGEEPAVIRMASTIDGQLVVAICTPIMKRVLQMVRQTGEMIFIDFSENMDRHNLRVFFMMTHSCVGGLPVGCFMATDETQNTITCGLELLKMLLPDGAFSGRGQLGPEVFMSDDCDAERGALQKAFPNSRSVLCIFHVLQAAWRWLWDGKHQIPLKDRQHLFHKIKDMVYAQTEQHLSSVYQNLVDDPVANIYPNYLKYTENIYSRRTLWALCLRDTLLTRGHKTNNICEAAMKTLKEKVLHRLKAFNALQLVDFIFTRMESYYERKLIDAANNRYKLKNTSASSHHNIDIEQIKVLSPDLYSVPSATEDVTYTVHTDIGLCTCPVGVTGAPCKHQAVIKKTFFGKEAGFSLEERVLFHKIARGENGVDSSWFMPLETSTSVAPRILVKEQSTSQYQNTDEPPKTIQPCSAMNEDLNDPDNACSMEEGSPTVSNAEFLEAIDLIVSRAKGNPKLQESLQIFASNAKKLKTDAALHTALRTFGKYSGAAVAINRKNHIGNQRIGVQPTAVARRKKPLLGGRRFLSTGRPAKSTFTPEHGYHKKAFRRKPTISLTAGILPPSRKLAAPHNLSECVEHNHSLGKTHGSS